MANIPGLPNDISMDGALLKFVAGLLDDDVLSDDAIYAAFGAGLPGHEAFGTELVARGRDAFRNARRQMREVLCPRLREPWAVALVAGQQSGDAISLAAVIASILGSAGLGLNVGLAAILIVRAGVRNLCPDLPT